MSAIMSVAGLKTKKLRLRLHPDPVLHAVCDHVTVYDKQLRVFADRMFALMRKHNGIGLAAPQIGVLSRVVVIDIPDEEPCLVNPEIVSSSLDTDVSEEGCLSLPDQRFDVRRSLHIEVRARTVNGTKLHFEAHELFARVIQHEVDHLDGTLICDKGTVPVIP
jgi:peptide deformylase